MTTDLSVCTGVFRTPVQWNAPAYPGRSPLNELGDGAVRSKTKIGEVRASVKAHLTPEELADMELLTALDELEATVAADMLAQIEAAWGKGYFEAKDGFDPALQDLCLDDSDPILKDITNLIQ